MGRVRGALAICLIVLGCVLAPLAVVTVWAADQIQDTGRYVETMAPLAGDPAVQQAIATRAGTTVTENLDVKALLAEVSAGLPARAQSAVAGLAAPLTSAIGDLVRQATLRVVQSPEFRTVWREANRTAHAQLVAILSGSTTKAVRTVGNSIVLDLGPIIQRVKQRLVAAGLSIAAKIPDLHPTFTLLSSKDLPKAQRAYSAVGVLRWLLPLLALVLLMAGVLLAHSRRRALVGTGLGLAAGMLVLGIALTLARHGYLNQVHDQGLNTSAASAVFDTLLHFLRDGLRAFLIVGLLIAAGAWLTGGGATAVKVREGAAAFLGRRGPTTGPFGSWVHAYRTPLRIAAVAVGALVFVFWQRPSGLTALVIALCVLAVLAVIQLFAGPAEAKTA